jgi:ATP-binding cassette, subfamily B, bacterial CvaB/MchF/RaxB
MNRRTDTAANAAPHTRFWASQRLPVVLQTEAAECGLACMAMISTYWGHRIDMASMRRRYSVSLKGATLKSLIAMGQVLSLNCRPLKLDMQHLQDLKLPCILHWDMNHFVVLAELTGQDAVIHDPAVGARRILLEELSKHFSGVALELTPGGGFKPVEESQRFTLLSLMGRVVGLRRSLVQVLALAIGLQVCVLLLPFYLQWVIDEALISGDRDLLTVLGIGFLAVVVIQTLLSTARSWVSTVLATDLNFQWLGNVFAHLMRLPLPYFEKRHLGDIVSRFGSIQAIQHTLTSQFVEGLIDGLLVVFTFGVMLLYSVQLTIVACVAVFLYTLLRMSVFRALKQATSEQIIHAAKQQTHFLESVRGVQSVRLFGRSDERRVGWLNLLADQMNAELVIAKLSISYQTANTLLVGAERVLVIWLAALAVLDQKFSVGMLFAFIAYKDQFSQRLSSLIDKLFEFRMLRLHGDRVADIVLADAEEEPLDEERDASVLAPTIELRNVSFRYASAEPFVVQNLSLTIPAGQCIAITGPSGCGKTTAVKLILGLLTPTEGEVLYGGVLLSTLGLQNYRKVVGAVMQDDHLFSGSLADNIAFFDPSPEQQGIEEAARAAAIHDEIAAMPMAYNTLVGDIGTGLSGGQKQRVLLARALYARPRLMVLDEATSHLDIWNERMVNAAILGLDLTRIVVAHRPETIAMTERVVEMANGSITEDRLQTPLGASAERTAIRG